VKKPKIMASKVITSGSVVEIYEYEDGNLYDFEKKKTVRRSDTEPEDWRGKEDSNLRRARQTLRRTIWANMRHYSKFLTLTYAENMQDYERFKKDWQRFIKNMKRHGFPLRYLYVLEYQKRGAIHAHVVVFNDEVIPIEAIENAWKKGFVKINSIKDVNNLGAYVCKYLTKETIASYGSHSYHVSRGLQKPEEIKIDLDHGEAVEAYLSGIAVKYQSTYSIPLIDSDGKQYGSKTVKYTQGRLL
jgi:hypothetical protein